LLAAVVRVAKMLMQRGDLPNDAPESPTGGLFPVISFVSTLAPYATSDRGAALTVVNASRLVIETTDLSAANIPARLVALEVVSTIIRPSTDTDVLDEALKVIEVCVGEAWLLAAGPLAEMVSSLAARLDDADLARILVVCARPWMIMQAGSQLSVEHTLRRLMSVEFSGSTEARVLLLATGLELREQQASVPQCNDALRLLGELDCLEPFGNSAMRMLVDHNSSRSADLAAYIDSFVPPPLDELARLRIVGVCGRAALSDASHLRGILHAACLLPRRVGLAAAETFRRLIVERGAALGSVGPADFPVLGRCLESSAGRAGALGPDLRGLDIARVGRIASEVLEASGAVVGAWEAEHRRLALRSLCDLAGNLHAACREPPSG